MSLPTIKVVRNRVWLYRDHLPTIKNWVPLPHTYDKKIHCHFNNSHPFTKSLEILYKNTTTSRRLNIRRQLGYDQAFQLNTFFSRQLISIESDPIPYKFNRRQIILIEWATTPHNFNSWLPPTPPPPPPSHIGRKYSWCIAFGDKNYKRIWFINKHHIRIIKVFVLWIWRVLSTSLE